MINLKNKNIIVTGASGGIGNSIVEKLSEFEANILATGTKTEKLEELKREEEGIEEEYSQTKEELEEELNEMRSSLKKFHRDPLFIGGSIITLLAFLLPNVTKLPGWLVFIGLAGIGFLVYLVTMMYSSKENRIKKREEEVKKELGEKNKRINSIKEELKIIDELAQFLRSAIQKR
jgi:septin family protein